MGKSKDRPPPAEGTFGRAVWDERKRQGWNQTELAKRAGIGQSQVSSIESKPNTPVKPRTLFGIADAFGCDPRALALHATLIPAQTPFVRLVNAALSRYQFELTPDNLARLVEYGEQLRSMQKSGGITAPDNLSTDGVEEMRDNEGRHRASRRVGSDQSRPIGTKKPHTAAR